MNGRPAADPAHSPRPAADRLVAGRPQPPRTGRGGIYRQEALRHRAMSRVVRMPLVISTPSFLVLWVLVAAILVTGTLLTMVAVKAAS